MPNFITILSIEVEDRSFQPLEESCTLVKSSLNLDSLSQSSWLKSPAQLPTCLVATSASIREEVKSSRKLKSKAHHFSWSKPTFLSLNLSASPVILDRRLEEKLSHNVHSVNGKSSVVIHLRKDPKLRLFAFKSERERVSTRPCLSLRNSMISCD